MGIWTKARARVVAASLGTSNFLIVFLKGGWNRIFALFHTFLRGNLPLLVQQDGVHR